MDGAVKASAWLRNRPAGQAGDGIRRKGIEMMRTNRREFVYSLAALATAPPRHLWGQQGASTATAASLNRDQMVTLAELCEQIVPADDFPGAKELGVAQFIERTLKEAHPGWIQIYQAGLGALDASSRELYDIPFASLEEEQKTGLVGSLEKGELPPGPWTSPSQSDFFAMVRSHTMQGYYGHPKWGGNRDKSAWKMIGYDDWWV